MSSPKNPAAPAANPPADPKPAAAKPAAAKKSAAASGLTPTLPEGYTPTAKIEVLSESDSAEVVTDGVMVWKRAK